jgi:hypothetical protein
MLLAHVAHEARIGKPADDGTVEREHLEQRVRQEIARHGEDHPRTRAAMALLDGPPVPSAFNYLLGWSLELHGRSGVGMDGYAPLSFASVESWARLTGRTIEPHEVHALLSLDEVRRNPPEVD